ncbi:MAG: nucleotidyltransferase [Acidobacteria bacterium]|nr:nucleotidyltransferase [Acidobacteriota bacterium]MCI0624500.1 nucleotidyltransferase [Acidobacteriota bacterium]MCI0722320.1 nucleotidyltransferase [Acidobacteriota bacterium]
MSFDESFLAELLEALSQSGLEVVLIGNTAAILHGVPVMTQDVDLMIRDQPRLEQKLKQFASAFGVRLTRPYEPTSQVIRAIGRPVTIDFVRALSSRKSFASIRSRAARVRVGKRMVWVASLEDVIAAKEAAGRPKDKATLGILKEAQRVKRALENQKNHRT